MLIEIPFVHQACVTRRGRRNSEVVGLAARLPVRIPEAGAAPVAARWSGVARNGSDGGPIEERWDFMAWRGGLVTPWRPQSRWGVWDRADPVAARDLQAILDGLGHDGHRLNPFTPKAKNGRDPEFEQILGPDEPIRTRHWDTRGEAEDHIRRRASRWALADGMACEPSPGPVWYVGFNDIHVDPSPRVEALPWRGTSLECRLRTFRGDRFQDAMAHARALAEAHAARFGEPVAEVQVLNEIEILDAASFADDDDGRALRGAVVAFLEENQKDLHRFPAAAGKAHFDLRDAAAAAARQRSIGLDWDRLALLGAARAVAEAHEPRPQGYNAWKLGELREALARIDRGRAPAPALPAPGR